MSEIRYDRLNDIDVIIAPERLHKPDYNIQNKSSTQSRVCPFCEGEEALTPPEIFAIRDNNTYANEKGWHIRVIPNLYKALQIESEHKHHFGQFEYWEGFGAHEIIIDTPKHLTSMAQWKQKEVQLWLQTLATRVADLRKDSRMSYISLFKNEGFSAGSTQEHSHTQLIALPIIPKLKRDYFQRSYTHYKETGEALLETMIAQEEKDSKRIVHSNGDFTAFCPYASAYPFEVIISSKKPLGQIDTLNEKSIIDLSALLLIVINKLQTQLGCLCFNLLVETPPLQEGSVEHELLINTDKIFRFFIRITPRIYRKGGFELDTNMDINPLLPELAAKLLRESHNEKT